MPALAHKINLSDEAATIDFAQSVAKILRAGDTILLEGPIGAGKTFFARHLIQTRLGVAEDVPSPTFTLVQVYDDDAGDIWHCDLYRLTHPDEAVELGLEDAFETAICLIEWPDRLGDLRPLDAMTLTFTVDGDARIVVATAGTNWQSRWAAFDV